MNVPFKSVLDAAPSNPRIIAFEIGKGFKMDDASFTVPVTYIYVAASLVEPNGEVYESFLLFVQTSVPKQTLKAIIEPKKMTMVNIAIFI
jgi:hypothetical protein